MLETEKERMNDIFAGIVVLAVAVVGLFINISSLAYMYRSPKFHNAFGIFSASHLVSDIGFLFPHMLWVAPAILFKWSSSLMLSDIGKAVGQLQMLFCNVALYSQIQFPINRLAAVFAPFSYSYFFSTKGTISFIALIWSLGILRACLHFIDGCEVFFNATSFTWSQLNTPCRAFTSLYLEYILGTAICLAVILMNMMLAIKLNGYAKKLTVVNSKSRAKNNMQNIHRHNLCFSLQSGIKAVLFATALLLHCFLYKLAASKWAIFVTRTFSWELAHCVNGIVVYIVNDSVYCCQKQRAVKRVSSS